MLKILKFIFFLYTSYSLAFTHRQGFYIDENHSSINQFIKKANSANHQDNLKVIWWNTLQDGSYSNHKGKNLLRENLKSLKNYADIIILGESFKKHQCYYQDHFSNEYKYQLYLPYTKREKNYIFTILSKFPIDVTLEKDLKWFYKKEDQDYWSKVCPDKTCNSFERKLFKLELTAFGKKLSIFPIHFLQPWGYLNTYLKKSPYHNSATRKVELVAQMLTKSSNPLNIQAREAMQYLDEDENFLLIGDFNVPQTIFTLPTISHVLFRYIAKPIYFNYPSFPTKYSTQELKMPSPFKQNLSLDHAYMSYNNDFEVQNSQVLPLVGSDHYPIFMQLVLR